MRWSNPTFRIVPAILHVTDVEVLSGYRLRLAFNNGAVGVVDLSSELTGPVFARLADLQEFSRVELGYGTVTWSRDIDLAPEYL